MKRPLFFTLIFLIFGILLCYFIKNIYIIFGAFFCVYFISHIFNKIYKTKYCFILFFVFLIGYFTMFFNSYETPIKNKILNSKNIYAQGVIKNVQNLQNDTLNLIIKIDNIKINNQNFKKSFYISTYLEKNKNIKEGYGIELLGDFSLGKLPNNPNGFNEFLNFKSKGIDFKVKINEYKILNIKNKFDYFIANLNENISNIYDKILPPLESGILKSIIIGNKESLDNDLKNLYINAGIYHILAISGLHLGILSIFLNKILSKIFKKYSNLIIIFILIFYCIFTGANLSTIRATLMISIMLIAKIIYRDYDLISSASLAGIILLLFNPYNIFNIGFIFSFASVFSIAFLGSAFVKIYNLKGIKASLVISFFISLAIKPISAYFFYNISTLDFLLNLIILPFTSVVVCLGFIINIISIFSINFATFLASILYYIFRFFTFMCKIVEKIPFGNLSVAKPSLFLIICFYLMLIFVAYAVYNKKLYFKNYKYIKFGLIIFLTSIIITLFTPSYFKITMLDVGQGECIVGEKEDATFIIDAGSQFNYNAAKKVILPYLKSRGITQLDFLFISHMDSDHINAVFDIIPNLKIENIFVPNVQYYDNKNYDKLVYMANQYEINIFKLNYGNTITLDNDIYFNILSPTKNFNNKYENNNSLVFELNYYNNKLLFTGDMQKNVEKDLIPYLSDVDILKVAHHGSKTSSIPQFLEKTNPEVALISCGINNRYNHPNKDTLDNLKNSKVFRTDLNGAISITLFKNKYFINTMFK